MPLLGWLLFGGAYLALQVRRMGGRVLSTPDNIFAAMQSGQPLIGQTEICDEASGRTAGAT